MLRGSSAALQTNKFAGVNSDMLTQTTRGRLMASTVLGAILISAPAFAQEAASNVEELVITGSRIVRQDLTSSSPVATVGDVELKANGVVNTENLLATLPQPAPAVTGTVTTGDGRLPPLTLRRLRPN